MAEITEKTKLTELAAIVSDALQRADIVATLSGGAAVSIYTENRYQSEDLDFVTVALVDELKAVLEPLGFQHTGRLRLSVFEHPATLWYIEFPPAPLSFGGTYVDPSHCALIKTPLGALRIITPTHSVMDRLIAAAAWNEAQSLEQALLVASHQIDYIEMFYNPIRRHSYLGGVSPEVFEAVSFLVEEVSVEQGGAQTNWVRELADRRNTVDTSQSSLPHGLRSGLATILT